MKTYEQLMKHYWGKIVPMAESAGINPWECVRHDNDTQVGNHPRFILKPYERYTFALTVLEQRPLFKGDTVYWKIDGELFIWEDGELDNYSEDLTWTPPTKKRTFMLGDKELPCPDSVLSVENGYELRINGHDFWFKDATDGKLVRDTFIDILLAATRSNQNAM